MKLTRRSFLEGAGAAGLATGVGLAVGQTVAVADETEAPSDGLIAQAYLNPEEEGWKKTSSDFATLFSPIKIGGVESSHRIMKSAAGSATYLNGPTDEMFEYYLNFAKGGVELIMMEFISWLGPNPMEIPGGFTSEDVMAWGKRLSEECAKYGASLGVQFVPMPMIPCDEMTKDDIIAFQDGAVAYCKWYQEMGFKGIDYHLTGSTLNTQFLSRFSNHRDDEYGPQSPENRARIVCETVKRIHEEVSPDFFVEALLEGVVDNDNITNNRGEAFMYLDTQVNTPRNEMNTLEENLAIAKCLEEAGMDAICIRMGIKDYHPAQFAPDTYFFLNGLPGMSPWAYQYDFDRHFQGLLDGNHSGAGMTIEVAAKYKEVVSIPVGTVSYCDPAIAPALFEDALAQGKVDYYMMTRPLTIDPEYVNKLRDGRIDEIPPCTRCLHCHIGSNEANRAMGYCRVNALTQRVMTENGPATYELPPLEGEPKKVMVIGGGPAGMEAARIAAARGHDVTLFEKNGFLGGKLDFAYAIKGPHENLDLFKEYLIRQLEINGVAVETGVEVDAAKVAEFAPDVVILATGSLPTPVDIPGGVPVVDYDQFFTADLGHEVVIMGGNAQAFDAALWCTVRGKHVQIVTDYANEDLDKQQSQHARRYMLTSLYALGVQAWPGAQVKEIGDGFVTIETAWGVDATLKADSVINALDGQPNVDLLDQIDVAEKYAIGDCDTPFNIALAIRGGNDVGRAI